MLITNETKVGSAIFLVVMLITIIAMIFETTLYGIYSILISVPYCLVYLINVNTDIQLPEPLLEWIILLSYYLCVIVIGIIIYRVRMRIVDIVTYIIAMLIISLVTYRLTM